MPVFSKFHLNRLGGTASSRSWNDWFQIQLTFGTGTRATKETYQIFFCAHGVLKWTTSIEKFLVLSVWIAKDQNTTFRKIYSLSAAPRARLVRQPTGNSQLQGTPEEKGIGEFRCVL